MQPWVRKRRTLACHFHTSFRATVISLLPSARFHSGVGVNLTRVIALETGFSLYRMSGMNMLGLPFETKDPLLGPNFTLFVPAELVLEFKGKQAEFDIKGVALPFMDLIRSLTLETLTGPFARTKVGMWQTPT
ncbi:MAG: hypothetical protein HWD62_19475 [Cyclobacteriaceae bacterium]|nr:MAG: hypothetical protein HWD62_19475 [Cyclobacteriaceae bacterium]